MEIQHGEYYYINQHGDLKQSKVRAVITIEISSSPETPLTEPQNKATLDIVLRSHGLNILELCKYADNTGLIQIAIVSGNDNLVPAYRLARTKQEAFEIYTRLMAERLGIDTECDSSTPQGDE